MSWDLYVSDLRKFDALFVLCSPGASNAERITFFTSTEDASGPFTIFVSSEYTMMTPIEKAQAVANAQDILGVATHATEIELRKAWKKLAFEMHPDRGNGTSHELANINAAYNLLRTRSQAHFPNSEPANDAPASPASNTRPARSGVTAKRVRPRPVHSAKITSLTELIVDRCRKTLDDGGATKADHVPAAIRRMGREVEYIVETPLAKGVNRIALPVCDYSGTGQSTIRTITFSASDNGAGTFSIPEHLRRQLFRGARDVRIHFAKFG
ncbi:MAG: J domain-containing protein [Boseongicola sp.]